MVNPEVKYRLDLLLDSQSLERADTLRREFYADFNGKLSKEDIQYISSKIDETCGTPYSRLDKPDRELLNQKAMLGSVLFSMGKES